MNSPAVPLVDVIIPVHTTERPIDRAVSSVLSGGLPVTDDGGLHITIVSHNISADRIGECLSPANRELVELVECFDDTQNPARPRNLALDRSTARYVSFLDSDDTMDPGALARWVDLARRHGSAAVLARVSDNGKVLRAPVTRPWRSRDLDPVKDRLIYRVASFGLLSRAAVEELSLRFPEHFATGEDQSFTARLYADGGRIDYARGRPGYHRRDDAVQRVTSAPRPLADDLAPFLDLAVSDWMRAQSLSFRRGYAVKVMRIHLFGQVTELTRTGRWTTEDADAGRAALQLLLAEAPGAERAMCRADRSLIDLLAGGETDAAVIARAARVRRRFGTPATVLPRDLTRLLHRDGSLRFMAAAALMR